MLDLEKLANNFDDVINKTTPEEFLEWLKERRKKHYTDRLNEIKALEVNWNGYGAEPIPAKVIDKALEAAMDLMPLDFEIFPCADGSINFEYCDNGTDIILSIYEDECHVSAWNNY